MEMNNYKVRSKKQKNKNKKKKRKRKRRKELLMKYREIPAPFNSGTPKESMSRQLLYHCKNVLEWATVDKNAMTRNNFDQFLHPAMNAK